MALGVILMVLQMKFADSSLAIRRIADLVRIVNDDLRSERKSRLAFCIGLERYLLFGFTFAVPVGLLRVAALYTPERGFFSPAFCAVRAIFVSLFVPWVVDLRRQRFRKRCCREWVLQ